jgi:predicted nucleic acid-binding protein
MAERTLVDTDVLVDAARGVQEAATYLVAVQEQAALTTSVVTQMELIVGCRGKTELRKLERFLSRFRIVKVSEAICDVAVGLLRRFRLSHGLLIPDALIAATALSVDAFLATKNVRHYHFVPGLKLLSYPHSAAT